MKLLPKNTRVNTEDSLGHGMDAMILMGLFFLGGLGLDALFGTRPIFMVALTVVGAIGIFATFKYRYEARMDELQAQRAGRSQGSQGGQGGQGAGPTGGPAGGHAT